MHHAGAAASCTGTDALDLACRSHVYTALAETAGVGVALAHLDADRRTDGYLRGACHEIVHHLGVIAGEHYRTVLEAYAGGTAMCSGGYYHGVTEAVMVRLGRPAADDVCAEVAAAAPRSLRHLWCAHGMGHGYLDLSGGDVFAALAACDGLPDWEAEQCYGGVFMENVTSLADAGGPSRFLHADDPLYPAPPWPTGRRPNATRSRRRTRCSCWAASSRRCSPGARPRTGPRVPRGLLPGPR